MPRLRIGQIAFTALLAFSGAAALALVIHLLFPRAPLWQIHVLTLIAGVLLAEAGSYTAFLAHDSLRREVRQLATQHAQAEEARRESEARWRAMMESSSDVVTLLDADGTIRYESDSFARVAGYSPAGLIGQNILEYAHPDDRPRIMNALRDTLAEPGKRLTMELPIRRQDGSWGDYECTGRNLLDHPAVRAIVVNTAISANGNGQRKS